MRNILYEGYEGPRLPKEVQMRRVERVIGEALTEKQREVLLAYYYEEKTLAQIAAARKVHKSTVCRTLHRAEKRVRERLRY